MKTINSALTLLFFLSFVCGCADAQFEQSQPLVGDTSDLLIYYSACEDEQPVPGPTWCDMHEDGSACCTWDKQGFHEEWCQYPDNWCWELNGVWR